MKKILWQQGECSGLQVDGKQVFLHGANYMTAGLSMRMWQQWNPEQVRCDFKKMRDMGMNAVKVYLFWGDFLPVPEAPVCESMLAHLDELIAVAKENDLFLVIDMIVGHMSGENYAAPWGEGRDLIRDAFMLRMEASYVRQIAERYAREESILMWDVCNEISLYNLGRDGQARQHPALFDKSPVGILGDPPTTSESYNWLRNLVDSVKSVDRQHMVYSGVGTARGFALEDMASASDAYACYAYPWNWNQCATYLCGFESGLAHAVGMPCIVEEFGTTKTWNSPEYEAEFYGVVLYSSYINGAIGALSWQYCDFDSLFKQDPYLYHAWEIRFGMVRADGTEYPCADSMREFDAFLRAEPVQGKKRRGYDAYILLNEGYDKPHAFNSVGQQDERNAYYEAYRRLTDAGLRAAFLREGEEAYDAVPMIYVPSCGITKLRADTWIKLKEYVQRGGNLLAEMKANTGGQIFDEIFGVAKDRPFSYPEITASAPHDFGPLHAGDSFRFEGHTHLLHMELTSGQAVLNDSVGHPICVANRLGQGKTFLVAVPLVSYAEKARQYSETDDYGLIYGASRDFFGITPAASFDQPCVESALLEGEADAVAVVINHRVRGGAVGELFAARQARCVLDLDTGEELPFALSEEGIRIPLSLDRSAVRKLHIKG